MRQLWARFGVTLSEPSTWRGFVMLLSAIGITLDPDQQNAIVVFGLAASGLIGVFFRSESNPAAGMGEPSAPKSINDVIRDTRE